MKKSVIITGPGFQDEEYIYPYYRLLEEGFHVEVATKDGETVIGKYGVPARATIAIRNLNPEEFDLVVLPGGFEAPDRVRLLPEARKFVKDMHDKGKIIAAICHGPWICISAGIMKGKKATAYMSIEHDMINAGVDYVQADVVVDGNLVTSPHYKNNGDFMKAAIKAVYDNDK